MFTKMKRVVGKVTERLPPELLLIILLLILLPLLGLMHSR